MVSTEKIDQEPFVALHVMLVDDDKWALEELAEIIELEGWQAYTAADSSAALATLEANQDITLVVTDVHIVEASGHVTSGIDLVSMVNQNFPDRQIEFVVLSGDADAVSASIESGAVDFLTKPLIPDDLIAALLEAHRGSGSPRASLTEFLLRKVSQKTRSLQRASVDLEARNRENAVVVEQEARLQEIRENLTRGMQDGHIVPWLQPQVCVHSGRLIGFEALARWTSEAGFVRNPMEFLAEAAEANMLVNLDKHLQSITLDYMQKIESEGILGCEIGINITAEMLGAENVVADLIQLVDKHHFSPTRVGIEVLESAMLDDSEGEPLKENIAALSKAGFSIQLDDFGTGHTSLTSLRDLAVDRVKIDRSFVQDVHLNPKLQTFTRTLIQLAKSLEIEVLAEGVECQGECDWLKNEGCNIVQGYFIAKPMPIEIAIEWAQSHIAKSLKSGE